MSRPYIKAISLWEPWASLIYTGAKRYETRSWATSYRGPLMICATQNVPSEAGLQQILDTTPFQIGLSPLVGKPLNLSLPIDQPCHMGVRREHLQFGKALCVVDLVDCVRTESIYLYGDRHLDYYYGDFARGRYAWCFENLRQLRPAIAMKGKQGLWALPMPPSVAFQ